MEQYIWLASLLDLVGFRVYMDGNYDVEPNDVARILAILDNKDGKLTGKQTEALMVFKDSLLAREQQ